MLTKWFGTRSSRSPKHDRFFRPSLEYLEGRLAPSGLVPMDQGDGGGHGHGHHGNGNGNDNGNGHGNSNNNAGGGGIIGPVAGPVVNQAGNVHNNIHITGSFNNNTGSFNNVASAAGAGFLGPGQAGAIGALFALSSLIATETSNSNIGTLIDDEIALAVDNYINGLVPGTISSADISKLTSAITTLESGLPFIGPAIGDLAYDVTFGALTAAQPTI